MQTNIKILSKQDIRTGETNKVYRCKALVNNSEEVIYIKNPKSKRNFLHHEYNMLNAIQGKGLKAPVPLYYNNDNDDDELSITQMPGEPIWHYIDPRFKSYSPNIVSDLLYDYGKHLAKIHQTKVDVAEQPRQKLYKFPQDYINSTCKYRTISEWLQLSYPDYAKSHFVHGDYNFSNVLIENGKVSGIVDWEYSGLGWKEYEIAWALRQRTSFFNTAKERQALLKGYLSCATYDNLVLSYCEILNYIHFAYWSKDTAYENYALSKAFEIVAKL